MVLIVAFSQTTQNIRSPMMQPGLFDRQNHFEKLNKDGDFLVKLNSSSYITK